MEVLAFLICEDIRPEMGGKFSLMGILSENLNIFRSGDNPWPISINLAAYVKVKLNDKRPDKFTFRISMGDEIIIDIADNLVAPEGTKTLNIPMSFQAVSISKPGSLTFSFAIEANGEKQAEQTRRLEITANKQQKVN
ncbi:MAG: hypothetical protein QM483_07350 [Desulfuromusa sp.]